MPSNSDTTNNVWDNLEELRHLFPTKSYQDLLEFKTQNNREGFEYLLEIIFDANSELAQKVQIEFMGIEEIAQALKIEAHDNFIDKKAYIDRANYWVEHYPKEDTIYAFLLHNLAEIYRSMGEYDKALEFYQKSLVIWEEVLGIKHPDTARSYNNIGLVYDSIGEYDKALEFYQKALAIREEVLGIKHPDTASSYNNIAVLYYKMRNYPKSAKYMQKAVDIWERVLPANHPNLINAKKGLVTIKAKL